jgi:adenylate kinase
LHSSRTTGKTWKLVIVLGPPGSGKGTQCKRLAELLKLPHLSTGDLLRHHVRLRTEIGEEVTDIMKQGQLVPDDVVMEILSRRLTEADCLNGIVLDGFPRTRNQAHLIDVCLADLGWDQPTSKWVFRLVVPEAVIIQRIAGRRTCPSCGKTFSTDSGNSLTDSKCDSDGSPLVIRDDDREETIKSRVQLFEREISAIVEYYSDRKKIIDINADRPLERVTRSILYRMRLGFRVNGDERSR